jgi:hypothetical protein
VAKKAANAWRDPHRVINGKVETLSLEDHMQVFARLARIRQGEMHGPPGAPKQRKGKG